MEDNQTYVNISAFQHNGTNCTQNLSCSIPMLWFTPSWTWDYITLIVCWVGFFVLFPGICFVLYKLNSQVRPDQVAPVYITNLLISDLIQICANPITLTTYYHYWLIVSSRYSYSLYNISWYFDLIYLFGVQVNVLFMMCVSAERYVMVAHAVWYRNIQNRKVSVIVSVTIWTLSAMSGIMLFFSPAKHREYVTVTVLLLPYPLVMFFFVATWRALSRSSVPHNNQIHIRSILGLILGIYTILFIPFIIIMTDPSYFDAWYIYRIAYNLVALNPAFDLLLYVLMRKDVLHMCKALLLCCNKRQGADITHG